MGILIVLQIPACIAISTFYRRMWSLKAIVKLVLITEFIVIKVGGDGRRKVIKAHICWYKPCSSTSNTLAGRHNGRICNAKTFNQCLNKANAIHYVLTSMQALKELLLLLLKLITSIQVLKELLLLLFKLTSLCNADVLVFRSD